MNPTRNRSNIVYILFFAAIIILGYVYFTQSPADQEVLSINQVAADINAGKISRIVEDDSRLQVIYRGDAQNIERFANKEPETTLVEQLLNLGVTNAMLAPDKIKIEVKAPSAWMGVANILMYVLPFLFLGGVFWFVFRQAQGSNNAAMSFGKSRARMFSGDQKTDRSHVVL